MHEAELAAFAKEFAALVLPGLKSHLESLVKAQIVELRASIQSSVDELRVENETALGRIRNRIGVINKDLLQTTKLTAEAHGRVSAVLGERELEKQHAEQELPVTQVIEAAIEAERKYIDKKIVELQEQIPEGVVHVDAHREALTTVRETVDALSARIDELPAPPAPLTPPASVDLSPYVTAEVLGRSVAAIEQAANLQMETVIRMVRDDVGRGVAEVTTLINKDRDTVVRRFAEFESVIGNTKGVLLAKVEEVEAGISLFDKQVSDAVAISKTNIEEVRAEMIADAAIRAKATTTSMTEIREGIENSVTAMRDAITQVLAGMDMRFGQQAVILQGHETAFSSDIKILNERVAKSVELIDRLTTLFDAHTAETRELVATQGDALRSGFTEQIREQSTALSRVVDNTVVERCAETDALRGLIAAATQATRTALVEVQEKLVADIGAVHGALGTIKRMVKTNKSTTDNSRDALESRLEGLTANLDTINTSMLARIASIDDSVTHTILELDVTNGRVDKTVELIEISANQFGPVVAELRSNVDELRAIDHVAPLIELKESINGAYQQVAELTTVVSGNSVDIGKRFEQVSRDIAALPGPVDYSDTLSVLEKNIAAVATAVRAIESKPEPEDRITPLAEALTKSIDDLRESMATRIQDVAGLVNRYDDARTEDLDKLNTTVATVTQELRDTTQMVENASIELTALRAALPATREGLVTLTALDTLELSLRATLDSLCGDAAARIDALGEAMGAAGVKIMALEGVARTPAPPAPPAAPIDPAPLVQAEIGRMRIELQAELREAVERIPPVEPAPPVPAIDPTPLVQAEIGRVRAELGAELRADLQAAVERIPPVEPTPPAPPVPAIDPTPLVQAEIGRVRAELGAELRADLQAAIERIPPVEPAPPVPAIDPAPLVQAEIERKGEQIRTMVVDLVLDDVRKAKLELGAKVSDAIEKIPAPGENRIIYPVPVEYAEGTAYKQNDLVFLKSGGLWAARVNTKETPSYESVDWICLVGSSEIEFEQDSTDPRKIRAITKRAGVNEVREFRIPMPLYKDVFRIGTDYELNDQVTHDGSTWLALKTGKLAAPKVNMGEWRLVSKSGKDGKVIQAEERRLWRGPYQENTLYQPNDIISHNGKKFQAKRSNRLAPTTTSGDDDNWLLYGV